MAYIAVKPCRLAGQSFKVGESVPAEVIQPGAAKNLVKMGVIAEGDEAKAMVPTQTEVKTVIETSKVIIHTKEGDLPLDVTPEGLQAVVDVLTSNVNDAEIIIDGIQDEDALILLDATDKRKSIQEAAEAQAKKLSKVGEA